MVGKYKIGICGTHCCGKTTLVRVLNELLGYPLITEVADRFPRETRGNLVTQMSIMGAQITEEMKNPFFISDRTVIDNLAYSTLCFEESISGVADMGEVFARTKQYMLCAGLGTDHLSHKPYDLIVFVDEMFPIEDNGNRCLNVDYQKWIFEFLKTESGVASINYGIPVIDVKGTTEKRIERILGSLE
jgi:nicotinamide riboside kinase